MHYTSIIQRACNAKLGRWHFVEWNVEDSNDAVHYNGIDYNLSIMFDDGWWLAHAYSISLDGRESTIRTKTFRRMHAELRRELKAIGYEYC